MDYLNIVPVLLILSITAMAEEDGEPSLDNFLVYPIRPLVNIRKRDTASIQNTEPVRKQEANERFNKEVFLGHLLQQNQALEHLLAKVRATEELTERLVQNYGKNPQQPKLPEKFEMPIPDAYSESENPFVKLGKSLPKYGNLVKNMIINNVREDPEPVALVEHDPKSNSTLYKSRPSRRSFGGDPGPEIDVPQGVSPWCLVATLCRKNGIPICGFDERFGYGKFDDFCHMLQVNCYYKYNFAVVAHCRPFLS